MSPSKCPNDACVNGRDTERDDYCQDCGGTGEGRDSQCTATRDGERCLKDSGHDLGLGDGADLLHVSEHANWKTNRELLLGVADAGR